MTRSRCLMSWVKYHMQLGIIVGPLILDSKTWFIHMLWKENKAYCFSLSGSKMFYILTMGVFCSVCVARFNLLLFSVITFVNFYFCLSFAGGPISLSTFAIDPVNRRLFYGDRTNNIIGAEPLGGPYTGTQTVLTGGIIHPSYLELDVPNM